MSKLIEARFSCEESLQAYWCAELPIEGLICTVPHDTLSDGGAVIQRASGYRATMLTAFRGTVRVTHQRIRYYLNGEKFVGCMYVTSTFSTVFSACSDFTTS